MATALDSTVVHDDFEFELTPSEEKQFFYLVYDEEKAKRRSKFVRQGMKRRQDHGSRGSRHAHLWDDRERDCTMAAKRRDFRAAGRQITGWL